MGLFPGLEIIELLSYLDTMKEGVEALGKLEGVAVPVLSYYLTYDTKDVYQARYPRV